MADIGLKISEDGVSVEKATEEQILMDFEKPFAKLDVTNENSFKNIKLFFANDPPNPDGVSSFNLRTEIHRFAHGYDYVPATWLLFENLNYAAFPVSVQYSQYGGVIGSEGAGSAAYLAYYVTDTDFVIFVNKGFVSGFGNPVTNIAGTQLRLRIYIFAEDIGV
jgi:hypothetical protein